ncbi:MAG: hypothetical protein MJ231_02550 [bacterium]|nr:hypothetical protein [bacterium]
MQVNTLRKLISNGWTIANRRQLEGFIGKKELKNLANEFGLLQMDNYAIGEDVFLGKKDFYKLINDGKNLTLKLGISSENGAKNCANAESAILLENENITIAGIAQKIDQFYKKVFGNHEMWEKPMEEIFGEPKTMSKLFSQKFKPLRHINEDGYYVTTIIDKKTGEPVEAFLKQINSGKQLEEWEMYVKHENGVYERIGKRGIHINNKEKKITPDWMESSEGASEYSGIGIRLHQLGVERMLQTECKTIEIDSLSSAFPFHYKCGFRSPDEIISIGRKSNLKWWLKTNNITEEEWERIAKPTYDEFDIVYANAKALEEIKKLALVKTKGAGSIGNTTMYLQGEELSRWIERAKSQPILLD